MNIDTSTMAVGITIEATLNFTIQETLCRDRSCITGSMQMAMMSIAVDMQNSC
jgi:hypothetical protein